MKLIKSSVAIAVLSVSSLSATDVLAVVNGNKISKADANTYLKATGAPGEYKDVPAADQKQVLDRLIERELFVEAASKSDVPKDPEFIKLLETTKEDLMVNQWMKKQYEQVVVSDSDAKSFYEKSKDKYKVESQVKAKHILVADEKSATAIIAELKPLSGDALKAKFIELAKSKSTGPSGKSGGDLGFFNKKSMVKPFSDAAFSMKPGEITKKPVKTQFGYHIIYIDDVKPASTKSYEKVKPEILQRLKQEQFRKKVEQSLAELKSKAKIEIESDKK